MARYGVGLAVYSMTFPYATLIVTVIGCFCIGLTLPSLERAAALSPEVRLFVIGRTVAALDSRGCLCSRRRVSPFANWWKMTRRSSIRNIGNRGVRNVDDARRYIRNGPVASHAAHGFGRWLVELVATAEPIGMCRLLKRGALADPDIGFESLPHRQFSPRFY